MSGLTHCLQHASLIRYGGPCNTLREKAPDKKLFERVVFYVRQVGYKANFGSVTYTYLEIDGWKYWTMGLPLGPTGRYDRSIHTILFQPGQVEARCSGINVVARDRDPTPTVVIVDGLQGLAGPNITPTVRGDNSKIVLVFGLHPSLQEAGDIHFASWLFFNTLDFFA